MLLRAIVKENNKVIETVASSISSAVPCRVYLFMNIFSQSASRQEGITHLTVCVCVCRQHRKIVPQVARNFVMIGQR